MRKEGIVILGKPPNSSLTAHILSFSRHHHQSQYQNEHCHHDHFVHHDHHQPACHIREVICPHRVFLILCFYSIGGQIKLMKPLPYHHNDIYRVFFAKGPTQKSMELELVPLNRIKSPSTLVPPKATRGAKNNQNWRFSTLQ